MKLTDGKIWKRIMVFYAPLLMSSLLQQLYNAADAVVVGKYFGADKGKEVADTIKTSLCMSVIGGIIIGAIGYMLTPQLLMLMNTPEDIFPAALTYMRIVFAGTLCSLVYNMGVSILRIRAICTAKE